MKKITILGKSFLAVTLFIFAITTGQVQAAPFGDLIEFWDDREESSTRKIDHSRWQSLLDKYLDDQTEDGINRFDYENVSSTDEARLESYLSDMQKVEPRQLNGPEQKAYWINVYNATTIFVVLEEGSDLSSIREIRSSFFTRGPWKKKVLTIVLQELSLDDIEHGILRPIWRDNRIHYAVNCASLGCPNLLKTAFTGDNVESLLDQAARDFINHPRGVSVASGELTLSSIFDWYAEDFGNNFGDLLDHLSKYAEPDLASKLPAYSGAFYEYDWALNQL